MLGFQNTDPLYVDKAMHLQATRCAEFLRKLSSTWLGQPNATSNFRLVVSDTDENLYKN